MPRIELNDFKTVKIELTPNLKNALKNSEFNTLTKFLNKDVLLNYSKMIIELEDLKKQNHQLECALKVLTK